MKQHKCTYRFKDGRTDKKIKLLQEVWELPTQGAVIERLVAEVKV